jgi:hypothetical protein
MARPLAAALVVLVALSGCQGLGLGAGGDADRSTVTPVTVPSPGERAVDANRLTRIHRAALENRSYTTTVTLSVRYPNGSVGRLTDTFVVASDDTYLYDRRQTGPYPEPVAEFTIWQNRTYETIRGPDGNVTVQASSGFDDTTLSAFLTRLLRDRGLTIQNGQLSGAADRARNVPLPSGLHDSRNATVSGEVRDDIIRTLRFDIDADYPEANQTVRVEIEYTVDLVGRTDPARPAWANSSRSTGG